MLSWRVDFVGGGSRTYEGGQWVPRGEFLILTPPADWPGEDDQEETPEALEPWGGVLPLAILPVASVLSLSRYVDLRATRRQRRGGTGAPSKMIPTIVSAN